MIVLPISFFSHNSSFMVCKISLVCSMPSSGIHVWHESVTAKVGLSFNTNNSSSWLTFSCQLLTTYLYIAGQCLIFFVNLLFLHKSQTFLCFVCQFLRSQKIWMFSSFIMDTESVCTVTTALLIINCWTICS